MVEKKDKRTFSIRSNLLNVFLMQCTEGSLNQSNYEYCASCNKKNRVHSPYFFLSLEVST